MSAYISGAVWLSGPPEMTRRYVLLAIADNANDEGLGWPSVDTIVEKTLLSKRTVVGCIADLRVDGWLEVGSHDKDRRKNVYQIVLDKLSFKRPKSSKKIDAAPAPNSDQIGATDDKLGATDGIPIRKNHQEPSSSLELRSEGFSLTPLEPTNGNGNGHHKANGKADQRHVRCRAKIEEFYQQMNDGQKTPWNGAEAKQLSELLKSCPTLTVEEFDQCLSNYSKSGGPVTEINFAKRPACFLSKLINYRNSPLDQYGNPIQ